MADETNNHFMNGFLLGALAGFVIGVLAAPRSGHEIRSEITERTRGIREQAEHLADRVRSQLQPETDKSENEASS